MEQFRLDKLVCDLFKLTRKQAKADIAAGNVTVNGSVVRKSNEHFSSDDEVVLFGQIGHYQKYVYIMMNKPEGVLSATQDRHSKTALDLLPEHMRRRDLFVAGRLDKNTTGFLLITNDGDFAHNILSPKKHIAKTYLANLRDPIGADAVEKFRAGIELKDFICKPALLEIVEPKLARITVVEGKFHQIKRMFASIGNEVLLLHRSHMGKLELDSCLKSGESRYISQEELQLLKEGYYND